jgi:hypothetical protein
MRTFILALSAASLAIPASFVLPAAAQAQRYHSHHRHYAYKEWRGRDGRNYCRRSDGTTGLVVGGVAGALVGRSIDTHGDRTVGTLGGAALGALAGRAIDRGGSGRHCR